LAAEYAAVSGFRLLAFPRGGAAALALLKRGVVHVAALHRSTREQPDRNAATVRGCLGAGYRLLRYADWQEGVVLPASNRVRSLASCVRNIRQWAAREPGSAARECLEELVGRPLRSRNVILNHSTVAESVKSGWAEAGVCVQLCAEEAGLRFIPVRTEFLDLCFSSAMEHDPRVQALIRVFRSQNYRRLVGDLPGYDPRFMGEMASI
jgi:molybdate-binding protein